MHSSIFFPSSLLIFLFLISITCFPRNVSSNICAPFDCGDIKGISYPFRENKQAEHCGHPELVLDCKKDENLVINIMTQKFKVIGIDQNARILKLVREDFKDDICPKQFSNISIDFSLFNYTPNNRNVTLLYDCDPVPDFTPNLKFSCPTRKVPREGYVLVSDLGSEFPWPCKKNLLVPVLKSTFEGLISEYLDVDEVLEEGFEVRWIVDEERHCQDCIGSGGMCGYNFTMNLTVFVLTKLIDCDVV